MAGWNRPVSFGTVAVIAGVAGFRVYQQHERDQEVRQAVDRALSAPPPGGYHMARTAAPAPRAPAVAPPTFADFDAADAAKRLQGVWLYEREIFAFDGDKLTDLDGDDVAHYTFAIAAPCMIDLHKGGDAEDMAFALETDGPRFDVMDGRDGDRRVVCKGSHLYVADGDHCQAWRRVDDGTWDPTDERCDIGRRPPYGEPPIVPVSIGDDFRPLELYGDAMAPAAPERVAQKFATIDDARRARAADLADERARIGRVRRVGELGLVASHDSTGAPVTVNAWVRDVDDGAGTATFADDRVAQAGEWLLACTSTGARLHAGEHVTVTGALGDGKDQRITLTGCKVTLFHPPPRH